MNKYTGVIYKHDLAICAAISNNFEVMKYLIDNDTRQYFIHKCIDQSIYHIRNVGFYFQKCIFWNPIWISPYIDAIETNNIEALKIIYNNGAYQAKHQRILLKLGKRL